MTKDENKSECLNDEGVRGHVLSFGFRHSFVIDHLSFIIHPETVPRLAPVFRPLLEARACGP
jgi:hypothetical protein